MLWRTILGTCVFLSLFALAARGCTCAQAPPGTCPGLQPSDVVFLGTVTHAEIANVPRSNSSGEAPEPGSTSAGGSAASAAGTATLLIHYRFHVDERFAGADAADLDIYSGGDDGDCGYRFKIGAQYLVYPQKEMDERLFASHCSSTRLASEALALLPQLRAMRSGQRIASVFGMLRRTEPPFLTGPDDPDEPMPHVALQLRSKYDRFHATTDGDGVYSIYDVHEGTYNFTASLPARMELSERSLTGSLPPFTIPNGACYEYDVDALPAGHIEGTIYGPDGQPLKMASLELYRAGDFNIGRPGLWSFQGSKGTFEFDHIGPGDYILVYNRANRMDPNSPFPIAFYPGVAELADAQLITLRDGQDLTGVKMTLERGYPTHHLRVHLKWPNERPMGTVTVQVKAEHGTNPAAEKIADGLWEFSLLDSGEYTVSAYQELRPQRLPRAKKSLKKRGGMSAAMTPDCSAPPRIETSSAEVSGADSDATDVVLTFPELTCGNP
jgi:hypothetical protein